MCWQCNGFNGDNYILLFKSYLTVRKVGGGFVLHAESDCVSEEVRSKQHFTFSVPKLPALILYITFYPFFNA